jgi:hypothetical protein
VPARRTNALAIVSLVAGCAQFVFCFFIGAIVAVVTGHIARGQIKRDNEDGAGMAMAGLVLGYIGIALTLLVIAGVLVFAFGFAPGLAQGFARDDARAFARAIVREEALEGRAPRDPSLLMRVYAGEHAGFAGACCDQDDIHLADGTRFDDATADNWNRVEWRIELSRTILGTKYACIAVPAERGDEPTVTDGRCG